MDILNTSTNSDNYSVNMKSCEALIDAINMRAVEDYYNHMCDLYVTCGKQAFDKGFREALYRSVPGSSVRAVRLKRINSCIIYFHENPYGLDIPSGNVIIKAMNKNIVNCDGNYKKLKKYFISEVGTMES